MRADVVYLQHILDAISKIESYAGLGFAGFLSASHRQDAVIRQLEIIGEAAKRLSGDLRSQHSEVPWRRIARLRDFLIHDQMGADLASVWLSSRRTYRL